MTVRRLNLDRLRDAGNWEALNSYGSISEEFFDVLFEGCVVRTVDSYIGGGSTNYDAIVFNPFDGSTFHFTYDVNYGGGGERNSATPDAQPEIKEFLAQRARDLAAAAQAEEDRHQAARIDVKGRRVKCVRPRAKAFGAEGVVFWLSEGEDRGELGIPLWKLGLPSNRRIGIRTDDGEVIFTQAAYCELVHQEVSA